MSNNKKYGRSFAGKGYYIALILCAVAIGISGYLYYHNTNTEKPQIQEPTGDMNILTPTHGDDIEAVATQPQQRPTDSTLGILDPTEPTLQRPIKTGKPLAGEIVAHYAMDCLSYNPTTRDWRVHNGIDIAAESGTEVKAAADGVVYTVYEDETMGTTVVIRHGNNYVTTYSSLAKDLAVSAGDSVSLGQVIGKVGNSALLESAVGDHVHFHVTLNDKPMDPLDFFALN